eukprot:360210-Chlamydomonas_euryale.AAC.15
MACTHACHTWAGPTPPSPAAPHVRVYGLRSPCILSRSHVCMSNAGAVLAWHPSSRRSRHTTRADQRRVRRDLLANDALYPVLLRRSGLARIPFCHHRAHDSRDARNSSVHLTLSATFPTDHQPLPRCVKALVWWCRARAGGGCLNQDRMVLRAAPTLARMLLCTLPRRGGLTVTRSSTARCITRCCSSATWRWVPTNGTAPHAADSCDAAESDAAAACVRQAPSSAYGPVRSASLLPGLAAPLCPTQRLSPTAGADTALDVVPAGRVTFGRRRPRFPQLPHPRDGARSGVCPRALRRAAQAACGGRGQAAGARRSSLGAHKSCVVSPLLGRPALTRR